GGGSGFPGEEQVAEAIDIGPEPREHHGRRAILLDDGGRRDDIARLQALASVDRALHELTVEAHEPTAGERALEAPGARRALGKSRAADGPNAGHAEVDPFDDVAAGAGLAHLAVAVAESLLVSVVEARDDLRALGAADFPGRQIDADLPRLAEISEIRCPEE